MSLRLSPHALCLQVTQQPYQRVVERAGQRLNKRRHLAAVKRFGHGDRVGQQEPDRGARKDHGEQANDAHEAEAHVADSAAR